MIMMIPHKFIKPIQIWNLAWI